MKKYGCTVVFGILFCVVVGWVLSCKDSPMVYPVFLEDTPVQYVTMLNRAKKLSDMTNQKEIMYNPVREDSNFDSVNLLNEEQQQLYESLLMLLKDNKGHRFYYRKDEDVYFRLMLEESWGWPGYWSYKYSSTGDRFAVPSIKEAVENNGSDPMHYCEPIQTENWYICFDEWMN